MPRAGLTLPPDAVPAPEQVTRRRPGSGRDVAGRDGLSRRLAAIAVDPPTGARTREAGLVGLDREMEMCRVTRARLAVAHIELVSTGRSAARAAHGIDDATRHGVVDHLKAHLRSFDEVIRLDGDRFVCTMPNRTRPEARALLARIRLTLPSVQRSIGLRTGVAELTPDDAVSEVIGRAARDAIRATSRGHR